MLATDSCSSIRPSLLRWLTTFSQQSISIKALSEDGGSTDVHPPRGDRRHQRPWRSLGSLPRGIGRGQPSAALVPTFSQNSVRNDGLCLGHGGDRPGAFRLSDAI